ncbi:hypothetical protein G6F55_009721 [Rhizopus delemar]|nr:hypothetical protein G6F43_002839 [Rhizopus delemar]KAG1450363.1 hypothetical protein G6F55_009721 [Rhizopus delemar]KAG1491226.1 hypothetical protein G6F54_010176 [Rhizopus delemar]KAG1504924.1 hypothetical protein G6F53_010294 [Rhizopus delemar]
MLSLREENTKDFTQSLCSAQFNSNTEGIEFCRQMCIENGFMIHCERLFNNTIHIYCFREKRSLNKPDYKFLLSQKGPYWQLERLCLDTDWPQNIKQRIDQLIHEKMLMTEISERIKTEFPGAVWDDRPLADYIMNRIKKEENVKRVQKLLVASTRLCSLAAASEDWTTRVESELEKMLWKYTKILKVPNELVESMVNIQLDKVYSDIEKSGTRPRVEESKMKSREGQDVQVMYVPDCTLFVRSQHTRSSNSAETSSRGVSHHPSVSRPLFPEVVAAVTNTSLNGSFLGNNLTPFDLTSPNTTMTSTSSPSIQQRMDYSYHQSSPENHLILSPTQYHQNNQAYSSFYSPETNHTQLFQRSQYMGYNRMMMQPPRRIQPQQPQQPNQHWP